MPIDVEEIWDLQFLCDGDEGCCEWEYTELVAEATNEEDAIKSALRTSGWLRKRTRDEGTKVYCKECQKNDTD